MPARPAERRLRAVETPPPLPPDAERRMGAVMADIAAAMHARLDQAPELEAHPFHRDLRDWAARLGGSGARRTGRRPALVDEGPEGAA